MRRRITRWAVLATLLLAGSTAVGTAVRGVYGVVTWDEFIQPMRTATRSVSAAPTVNYPPTAFGPPQPPDPAAAAAMAAPLDQMARYRAQPWMIIDAFDNVRTAVEMASIGVHNPATQTPTGIILNLDTTATWTATSTLADGPQQKSPLDWSATTVTRVAFNGSRTEARVIARHRTDLDDRTAQAVYRRWWLKQTNGQWKVYDLEDPVSRVRFAATITPTNAPVVFVPAAELADANRLLDAGKVEPAGAKLWAARKNKTVPVVEAARLVAMSRYQTMTGKPAVGERTAATALAIWPDTPTAELARAVALAAQKKYKEAMAAVAKFRAVGGDHPEAVRVVVRANAAAGDKTGAVAAIIAGRKDFPDDLGILVAWAEVAPDQAAKVGEAAAELPTAGPTLAKVLAAVPADVAGKVLEGYRTIRPNDPYGALFAAVGKPDRPVAQNLLREAFALPAVRESVADELATAAVRSGNPAAVFRAAVAAGEAAAVFLPLAEAAAKAPKLADELAQIAAEQGKRTPADPWPHYYAGVAEMNAGRFDAAATAFAAGMAKLSAPKPDADRGSRLEEIPAPDAAPKPTKWERFRTKRVEALFRAGKWRVAYDEVPPKRVTFDQLAALAADKPDVLAEVIAAHATPFSTDPELTLWRAEGLFRAKKYDECWNTLNAYNPPPESYSPRADDRKVRCKLRQGKGAGIWDGVAGVDDPLLRALVAAHAGETPAASEALADWLAAGHTVAEAYADEDLGPLLRKNAELANAFPEK